MKARAEKLSQANAELHRRTDTMMQKKQTFLVELKKEQALKLRRKKEHRENILRNIEVELLDKQQEMDATMKETQYWKSKIQKLKVFTL